MLSWQKRAELAETALSRADAGRTRLRSALAEQRQEAEDKLIEQERQLLTAQRQLRELEASGGGAMSESQMDKLRVHIDSLLKEKELAAAEKELEAQNALLGSAHTFHVQQQRFQERLQAELAARHEKERQHEQSEQQLQARLQELTAKLNASSAAKKEGGDAAAASSTAVAAAAASTAAADAATPAGATTPAGAASGTAAPPGTPVTPAVPAGESGYISSMLGSVFGDTISKAEQLPALQASFRSAMEELSRQTAQNASLRAELKGLRDAAALRARASQLSLNGPSSPRVRPVISTPKATVDGEAEEETEADAEGDAEAERASVEQEKEWLEAASKGFETATARVQEATSQRKEVMRGLTDVLWQLKRSNPDEKLEARATYAELAKMKDAVERQEAAEAALSAAASLHGSEMKKATDQAKEMKQRAYLAEAAVKTLQRRLDAATPLGGGVGAAKPAGGGGGSVSVDEKHLQQTEQALEAAVAEAGERRKSEGLMQTELVSSRDLIAELESKLATATTKLSAAEGSLDKARDEHEIELRRADEKHASLNAKLSTQLNASRLAESRASKELVVAREAMHLKPTARLAAHACAAVTWRVPKEHHQTRAARLRLAMLLGRAAGRYRDEQAAALTRTLLHHSTALRTARDGAAEDAAKATARARELLEKYESAGAHAAAAAQTEAAAAEAASSASARAAEAEARAAEAEEAAAEAAAQKDDVEKKLAALEADTQSLRAAGEGAEALTAQLHALRAAQEGDVEAVQAELENERKRHAAAEEALLAEMETERAHSEVAVSEATAETQRARDAASESARLAREEVAAALGAHQAALDEAAAERKAVELRAEAAEAAAAAAEAASLEGKKEARNAGESERSSLEASLVAAREDLAAAKEAASAQGAKMEQVRHEAGARVAKAEAAAAAAVVAAEERTREATGEAKSSRARLAQLEAKVIGLEAEIAADRMTGGGGGGNGGNDGNGDGAQSAEAAAAASAMFKSVQSERESLRVELSEHKARAASKVDELRRRIGAFEADLSAAAAAKASAEEARSQMATQLRRAESSADSIKLEVGQVRREAEAEAEELRARVATAERSGRGEASKVTSELQAMRKQMAMREAALTEEAAAARRAVSEAEAKAQNRVAGTEAEHAHAIAAHRQAAQRAEGVAAEQERQRLVAEERLRALEASAAVERQQFDTWKAQQSTRLESSRAGGSEVQAQLQMRIKQMELAVQASASAADEARRRELAQGELVKQLQMRAQQAAQAAATAGKSRSSFGGGSGEVLAAMSQVQAHAEALQSELSATQQQLQRERAQALQAQEQHTTALANAMNQGVTAKTGAETAVTAAKFELQMSHQAAQEVRLQADLLKQRLTAQLQAEQKRAVAREATLSQQREQAAQSLALERAAHAATKRESGQVSASAEEELRAARALVSIREADAAVANTARWAAQQLTQTETQRASRMEKQLYAVERDLRAAREEAKRATAAAAAMALQRPMPVQATSTADDDDDGALIPGLGTPSTPPAGAGVRQPRGPAHDPEAAARPKPKPPPHPRPSSLPDYRQTYGYGEGGGRGGSLGGGGQSGAALAFRAYNTKKPPMGAMASALQQAAPGAIMRNVTRLITGGSKGLRQREAEALRERASIAAMRRRGKSREVADDSLDGLTARDIRESEGEEEGEDDGDEGEAIRGRASVTPSSTRSSIGGTIRRLLGGSTPSSVGRGALSEPPTPRRVF